MDEERLFVETEKYQELCDIRKMPGEPQLQTLILEVKPKELNNTAASTGIFITQKHSKQWETIIIIMDNDNRRLSQAS